MKIKNYKTGNSRKYTIFILLFLAAFLERTVFDLGPNIEMVTMAMILASFYLGKKPAFWLTLAIMVTSDRIIGNSSIFLFTWSGFLIPALVFPKLFRNSRLEIRNSRTKVVTLTGTGLLSNLFFFIHTNLGVWILDSWGMYTKDLTGLINCYINALPFLKNQFLSSLVFIPTGLMVIETVIAINKGFQFEKRIIRLLNKTSVYRI